MTKEQLTNLIAVGQRLESAEAKIADLKGVLNVTAEWRVDVQFKIGAAGCGFPTSTITVPLQVFRRGIEQMLGEMEVLRRSAATVFDAIELKS